LRNKFVIGSGDTYAPGAIGGVDLHDHTFTGDTHIHTISAGAPINGAFGKEPNADLAAATGTTDTDNTKPPYYAKAFIMYKGKVR